MSVNDTSEEDESPGVLCPVCHSHFSKLAHHQRFSPDCAPNFAKTRQFERLEETAEVDSPAGAHLLPNLGSAPDDLLDVETLEEIEQVTEGKEEDSKMDLAEDDYQMLFNTDSYFTTQGKEGLSAEAPTADDLTAPSTVFGSSNKLNQTTDSCPVVNPEKPSKSIDETKSLESGLVFTVPDDFGKSDHCFTKKDRSMMRLYNICDQSGAPRYLMDRVLSQMKSEITRNNFNPLGTSLTLRDPFMARMHRKFPSPPPEAVLVQLECFDDPITMYRFNGMDQLQQHLRRKDLYGDLSRLNANQTDPFNQSLPVPQSGMREITEGTWHHEALSRETQAGAARMKAKNVFEMGGTKVTEGLQDLQAPDDLQDLSMNEVNEGPLEDMYREFLLTLEEYKDSTGSDKKEAYSLEPVLMSTGLLNSSFNNDPRSRFILGYIPNLANMKSSAAQTRRAGTQKGYGSSVRDYHKCLSILLQSFVEAQKNPPLLDIRLGNNVCRCRIVLIMGTLLGDGKSHDLSCGRVGAQTNTLRLSRAVLVPSDIAADTTQPYCWIKSRVIEALSRAALFDPELGRPKGQPYDDTIEYNQYLRNLRLQGERKKQVAGARRRGRMVTAILNKAMGSHRVKNAYFALNFASDYGVFGHTLADLMHLLEEGILKYTLGVFLEALSATAQSDVDDLVSKLFSAKANRCHGSKLFPRLNFTRGYSRLTLLSSEERTGAFLALIVVMVTEKGRGVLLHRFSNDFDQERKKRAERFKGTNKKQRKEQVPNSNINDDASSDEETPPAVEEEEAEPMANLNRKKEFVPCRETIGYVCRQISRHDLEFLYTEVFPEIPDRHIYECLKIIWESTYRLTDEYGKATQLPRGLLNIPPFRGQQNMVSIDAVTKFEAIEKLKTTFSGYHDPSIDPLLEEPQPSIMNSPAGFVDCCEQLLALRSFYSYSGEHCPGAVPMREDGSLNLGLVQFRTRAVGESLKGAINRGDGTNQWRIPKFIDMLLLPEYMNHLASTGRYHVGFCERGLKTWAKQPGNTSQKRSNGVFEGQCAARIREHSMVDYALTQMESDEETESTGTEENDAKSGGACFHIRIVQESPESRRKAVTCTRLNHLKKRHTLQFPLPQSILSFFKTSGYVGEEFEYRTEAVIDGITYRAHPNFQGAGPWYDFAMVRFDHEALDDSHVDERNKYPAKIIGFFRLLPEEWTHELIAPAGGVQELDLSVLVHSVAFQKRDSPIYERRTMLTRSWLYEVQGGVNPMPTYRVAGTTKSNVVLGGHIFGIEEIPGFHERYENEEHRRFIILSDMRKQWPHVFIKGYRGDR